MTALRDALTQVEDQLAGDIASLAERITNLPAAEDITQDDIDALKADASALEGLASTSATSDAEPQPADENGTPVLPPAEVVDENGDPIAEPATDGTQPTA